MSTQTYASVWDAICDDPVKAKIMKGKSEAFRLITSTLLEDRATLNQEQVLEKYKIDVKQLERLIRGQLSAFTMEKLLELVVLGGHTYDIVYRPLAPEESSGAPA